MSNVNGDNASDPFSIRDLFILDRRSENLKAASSHKRAQKKKDLLKQLKISLI